MRTVKLGWLVAAALAAAMVALGSGAALASEALACVQGALNAQSYDAGPVDGLLGARTRDAAARYRAARKLGLPVLSEASAERWCTTLTGVASAAPNAGDAEPSPIDRYRNSEPGALPQGIWFAQSVTTERRKLLVGDLVWLSRRGELEHGEDLAAFLGLPARPTGTDLVGWLLQHVSVISGRDICPSHSVFLWSWGQEPGRRITPAGVEVDNCDDTFGQDFMGWVNGAGVSYLAPHLDKHTVYAELLPVDDRLLVYRLDSAMAEPNSPAVMLNFANLDDQPYGAFGRRVARLSTLFHEAYHIASGFSHIDCQPGDLTETEFQLSYRQQDGGRSTDSCDRGQGPYMVDALIAAVLAANCGCTLAERRDAIDMAHDLFGSSQIPLRSPVTIGDDVALRGTGLIGRTLNSLPPEPYFGMMGWVTELELAECGDCGRHAANWRRQVATVHALADAIDADGGFAVPWTVTRAVDAAIDVQATRVWLEAAVAAADGGFNVPLAAVPACTQFAGGCYGTAMFELATGAEQAFAPNDPVSMLAAFRLAGFNGYLTLDTVDDPLILDAALPDAHAVIFDGCGNDGFCKEAWFSDRTQQTQALTKSAADAWNTDNSKPGWIRQLDDGGLELTVSIEPEERATLSEAIEATRRWAEARRQFYRYVDQCGQTPSSCP